MSVGIGGGGGGDIAREAERVTVTFEPEETVIVPEGERWLVSIIAVNAQQSSGRSLDINGTAIMYLEEREGKQHNQSGQMTLGPGDEIQSDTYITGIVSGFRVGE